MKTSTNAFSQTSTSGTKQRTRVFRRSAVAVAVALTVAGVTAIAKTTPTLPKNSPLVIEQAAVPAPPSFAALVERVKPAVVNVSVTGTSASASAGDLRGLELPDNPHFKEFFERFFGQSPDLPDRQGMRPKVQGVGSGFLVTADGYIVTSHHVVENASESRWS